MRDLLGISAGENPEESWGKLVRAIEGAGRDLERFAPLLAELLSIPIPEGTDVFSVDPKDRRRHLTSLVVALVDSVTTQGPLLILLEDAHWADDLSLDLLGAVLGGRSQVMVVVTSREPVPPESLSRASSPIAVPVAELSNEAARSVIASSSSLGAHMIERVVARAQGNPLFLQEIARIGFNEDQSLPETVNDVILARLDRLPPTEKTVLRLASVIGPTFTLDEVNVLAGDMIGPAPLQAALTELRALGFARELEGEVRRHGFAHALTRDVAYETLPYAERRRLHKRIAQHLEQRDAAGLEVVSELLLHHYEVAADAAKIVRYAAMSGERAAAVFAVENATVFYQRALAELDGSGRQAAPDRSVIYERLGDALEAAGQHKEAKDSFESALQAWRLLPRRPRLVRMNGRSRSREGDLCRKIAVSLERRSEYRAALSWLDKGLRALPPGSSRAAAQIHTVRSLTLFRKGLYEQALRWGRLGLKLSRRGTDHRELAYAHTIVANTYTELGRLRQALHHDRLAVRYYHDVGDLPGQALANGNVAVSYQMLGVLDGAKYHYELGLSDDEKVGNTSHAAIMHNNIAEVLLMLGEVDQAVTHLGKVLDAYRIEPGLTGLAGLAEVNLSRCMLRRGEISVAKSHLRRGMRLLRSVGVEGLMTEALLQKAELHLAAGDTLQGRRECRRALRDIYARETRILEARAERLLGRAAASLGDTDRAQSHLRTSVAIARRTGAGYEEALSLRELGALLFAVPAAGPRATRILAQAIGILSKMGAKLDLAEAEKLLESCNPATANGTSGVVRDLEVAAAFKAGRSRSVAN
jgi:tetratricopeptide (TPR) repeat protein